VTAPDDFVQKYLLLQEMTSQFPSTVSQSMFLGLIQHWGPEGLDLNVRRTQWHYRQQCNVMLRALDRHLGHMAPTDVVWNRPTAGMFIWLELPSLGEMEIMLGCTSSEILFPCILFRWTPPLSIDRHLAMSLDIVQT
jgi:DNA-binding transcriptional MocR family regulator